MVTVHDLLPAVQEQHDEEPQPERDWHAECRAALDAVMMEERDAGEVTA